jgi:hypothetical protein
MCNIFEAKPTMCVSFANETKTQVKWVAIVRHRVKKWVSANNTPPKGSCYCVPNSNEMIMRSLCLKTSKKYSGDGCALN